MADFPVDAIVVLGARVAPDGRLGAALRRRVERAGLAFHDAVAPVVICSGGRSWNGHVEALRMAEYLMSLGVRSDAILVEAFALSTSENSYYTTKLLRMHGWSRAALVSCPWHLPRAMADFQRCGLEVFPLPADSIAMSRPESLWRTAVERTCRWIDRARLASGVML